MWSFHSKTRRTAVTSKAPLMHHYIFHFSFSRWKTIQLIFFALFFTSHRIKSENKEQEEELAQSTSAKIARYFSFSSILRPQTSNMFTKIWFFFKSKCFKNHNFLNKVHLLWCFKCTEKCHWRLLQHFINNFCLWHIVRLTTWTSF